MYVYKYIYLNIYICIYRRVQGSGFRVFLHCPMAQGRSTKAISIIKWIRTSRLSRKNSLCCC